MRSRFFTAAAVLLCLILGGQVFAAETIVSAQHKYPDYSTLYLGKDKFERGNRRIFTFNMRLNKCAIKPIHTLWASVMPKYGIERIQSATTNIEYPIRLISTLLQKDFKASKTETVRFLTNTTVGLGGLYDPAKHFLKIKPVQEDMEQALAKCKCKRGPYIVFPVLTSTSPRGLGGKILDAGLNPSSYVATPVLAIVKAGIMVNRTAYIQPLVKMLESTYADPYDIAKKLYGIENHIKVSNYDRREILEAAAQALVPTVEAEKDLINIKNEVIKGNAEADNIVLKENKADITLDGYKPQDPVTDSMRTVLFEVPDLESKIWSEISIWNRSFSKRIKTSSVSIDPTRDKLKFKYILQKDRTAPIAIVYPSIGEGVNSHHSVVIGKIFYDEGYSVIIQGSHFQWEFVKSMPADYRPGVPMKDAEKLQEATGKILAKLEEKEKCVPREKTIIGTSFGALETLFLGSLESKKNTLGNTKYISINPPFNLLYAMEQMDRNSEEWVKFHPLNSGSPDNLQDRVAITAAKVIQTTNDVPVKTIEQLPFTQDEAKLITGFIMHQKLSDLIFTIENTPKSKVCTLYDTINNMNYRDYAKKYLVNEENLAELETKVSLTSISDFLQKNENYRIYHTLDDYLVTSAHLKSLKSLAGKKAIYLSNGGHLGFLYRKEFQDSLKNEISLKENKLVEN